ncbi:MAG: ornithine cyclodeaminase family protein [Alphaproteobacteria bacterium]|nr:ornithine cyclodeaminase family protein [Alphaproteobacteria bacterium]
MLVITNEEIETFLEMPACVEALEAAYRDLGNRDAVDMPRQDGVVDNPRPGAVHALKTMSGSWPAAGVAALRLNSDVVHWPEIEGSPRRVKIPVSQGDRYNGLVLLFSTDTGELLAMFNDGFVQKTRVGGSSGVAAKYLSRPESKVLGLIGSGWQATGQIEALAAVRELELVKVYSSTPANREAFAERYSDRLGIEVRPVASPEEAAEGADILASATNSMTPTITNDLLRPGMHITSVRGSEIPLDVLQAVDRLVVNSHDPVSAHAAKGWPSEIPEFVNGDYSRPDIGVFDIAQAPELKSVVAGLVPGREGEEQITCFHNYKGLGLQFAAIGSIVLAEARNRQMGLNVEDHYFSQSVHP